MMPSVSRDPGADRHPEAEKLISPDLSTLQRWMLSVITHPGGVTAGIHSDAAREHLNLTLHQVVQETQDFTSLERLAVYGNAYFARLTECLEAEFPAVAHAAGKEAFRAFGVGYLQMFPSTSDTLNLLGQKFPAYLRQTSPRSESGETKDWTGFLIQLAELEHIYMDVFDGPGEERLPPFSMTAIQSIPADRWGKLRLEVSASLRLCRFEFPVHDYITAVRENTDPVPPGPETTWLAVHRRDYIVRREALSELQWRLLDAIQRQLTLEAALEKALGEVSDSEQEEVRHLGRWFEHWAAAGFFRAAWLE